MIFPNFMVARDPRRQLMRVRYHGGAAAGCHARTGGYRESEQFG